MFRHKSTLFEVVSARLVGEVAENPIAECQSFFRVRLFSQSLLKHFCHK